MSSNWNVLVVNFSQDINATSCQESLAQYSIIAPIQFVENSAEAIAAIKTGDVAFVLYFAAQRTKEMDEVLRTYLSTMGPLAEFQGIVCHEPSPQFIAGAFEFGIEQFFPRENWAQESAARISECLEKLQDSQSPEFKTVQLQKSIISGDANKINAAKSELGDLATYDFRAAFAEGKAAEATGEIDKAIASFKSAASMNQLFRPSSSSLGENLLMGGKIDEAIAVFEKLDRTNPRDVERKSLLASAFIEKGDFEKAKMYSSQIEAMAPGSSKSQEVNAQILLSQGKLSEAFALMDKMENVGPFFAAKLNDLGIKLSQGGHGKNALALYQKAHKIVRPELRYKISLNAALACRRLKDFDLGLKYAQRCQKEFGSDFPKLAKVRQVLMAEKQQAGAGNVQQPPVAKTPERKAG